MATEKVAILGGHGQLGRQLQLVYPDAWCPTRKELDISDVDAMADALPQYDLVINCAAMHDLRKCEEDKPAAIFYNGICVYALAIVCSKLITISTNYVFGGSECESCVTDENCSHYETARAAPINSYGWSKLIGEIAARVIGRGKHLVVRTSNLYGPGGPSGKKYNFVDAVRDGVYTKIKYDEYVTPTSCLDLARAIKRHSAKAGTIHLANGPALRLFDFAKMIRDDVEPFLSAGKSSDGIQRPMYGGLASIHETGMLTVEEALKEYLSR